MGCCGGMAAILNVSWVDKRDVGVNEEDVVVMVNTWMAWGLGAEVVVALLPACGAWTLSSEEVGDKKSGDRDAYSAETVVS